MYLCQWLIYTLCNRCCPTERYISTVAFRVTCGQNSKSKAYCLYYKGQMSTSSQHAII